MGAPLRNPDLIAPSLTQEVRECKGRFETCPYATSIPGWCRGQRRASRASADAVGSPGTTTLYCATLVALLIGFVSTSVGLTYLDNGWWRNATVASGVVMAGWGVWLGSDQVWRMVRRRRLRGRLKPILADRARYLSGHPALPHACRLSVLLTADALVLDDDRRTFWLPLAALRQAQPVDSHTGRGRPWLVARNEYRSPEDPAQRLAVEFLDEGGIPRRMVLTGFQRTHPNDWTAALEAACVAVIGKTHYADDAHRAFPELVERTPPVPFDKPSA